MKKVFLCKGTLDLFWVGAVLVRQASSAVSGVGNLADPLVWSNENGECGQSTATLCAPRIRTGMEMR